MVKVCRRAVLCAQMHRVRACLNKRHTSHGCSYAIYCEYVLSYNIAVEGKYALFTEKSWYNWKSAEDCGLAMLKEEFHPIGYAMAFNMKSQYVKDFSQTYEQFELTPFVF